MRFFDFLFSKIFLKHFLLAIFVGNLIFWGSLFFLNFYTRHGESIAIPDVRGLSSEDAIRKLQETDMLGIITDSVFLINQKKGLIVEQNPPFGFKVKRNRKIFLTINSFCPERVKMPDLVGVSFRQAKAILETYGLKVGRLRYVPDIAKDNVLEQKYKGEKIGEGTQIDKGSSIDFVLGRGGDNYEENDSTKVKSASSEADEENL